jgi:hypothetical protein
MPTITDEHTFAARDVSPPVEVTTTNRPAGEELYLLLVGGLGIDHELTREEAAALRDALDRALQFQDDE